MSRGRVGISEFELASYLSRRVPLGRSYCGGLDYFDEDKRFVIVGGRALEIYRAVQAAVALDL